MATTPKVLLKRSSVAGKVPVASDLEYGELAINFEDGKIYYKDTGNNIKAFVDSARVEAIAAAVEVVALAQLDSGEVTNLVDSAYVQARVPLSYLEGLIDSAYVNARADHYTTSDFSTDFAAKSTSDLSEGSNLYYTKARTDSDIAASLNDSGNTVTITINNVIEDKVDSAYVLARVAEAPFLDSAATINLIDSAYVNARVSTVDSAQVTAIIDSAYINARTSGGSVDSAGVLGIVDSDYIKTVGGIDADLLDGQHGSYYRDYNNLQNVPATIDLVDVSNRIINDVDKAFVDALGVNADTLDGRNSTQFLRSDQSDSMVGSLTIDSNLTVGGYIAGPANMIIDPARVGTDSGTVQILGNLQVEGTTTTINSTTVSINDKNLVLADSAANAAAADGAGITIGGANATLLYAASGDKFVFNKGFEGTWLSLESTVDSAYVNARVSGDAVDSAYIKTVGGINAFTLNGESASHYLDYNNLQGTPSIPTVDKATIDALGVNADELDGQDGTYYLNYTNFSNVPSVLDSSQVLDLFDETISTEGIKNLERIMYVHDSDATVFTVSVGSKTTAHRYEGQGSSNGYTVNGMESPFIQMVPGNKYRFDQSNVTNGSHPIQFYYDAAKTTQYTAGVTTSGISAGTNGSYVEIEITDATPPVLHYQCANHGYMGNAIFVQTRNLTGFTTADLTEGSNLYYTDARVENVVDSAYVAARSGGGTFGLAANTGTHTFNTATETLTFLGTTGQINAGIAANNVTLELDQNINSITSISFEGDSTNNNETKIQAINPTADNVINLPDSSGTIALLSDIAGGGGGVDSAATIALITATVDSDYVALREANSGGGGGGSTIIVQDEGSSLSTAATTLNFVGSGVSASGTGTTKTITINASGSGGGGSSGGDAANALDGFKYTATAGQTVFTDSDDNGSVLSYEKHLANLQVFLNGILLVETDDYTETDSSTLTLATGADSDDILQIFDHNAITPASGVDSSATITIINQTIDSSYIATKIEDLSRGVLSVTKFIYEADSGQTLFTDSDKFGNVLSVSTDHIEVYMNGILLEDTTDFTATDSSITLTEAADSGYSLTVIETTGRVGRSTLFSNAYEFTADSGQTLFTGADDHGTNLNLATGISEVYLNGILLSEQNDYVATNTSITLNLAADSDDFLSIVNVVSNNIAGMNYREYKFTGYTGSAVLTGQGMAFGNNQIQVHKNGVLLSSTDYTTANGNSVTITPTSISSDVYIVSVFTAANDRATAYYFTADSGQTNFVGLDDTGKEIAYSNTGSKLVYVNGILLAPTDFTATSTFSFTLNEAAAAGDDVTFIAFGDIVYDAGIQQPITRTQFEFTADSGQTTFSGTDNNGSNLEYNPGKIAVYLNGLLLSSSDFTAANSSSVTLTEAADSGDVLLVERFLGNSPLPGLDSNDMFTLVDSAYVAARLGAAAGFTISNEGTPLTVSATTLDFVGSGVVATGNGSGTKTITITAGLDSSQIISVVTPLADSIADSAINKRLTWTEAASSFIAVPGDRKIVNTKTSGKVITLQAGATLGDEVRIIDGSGNAATNNITIQSTQKILGSDSDLIININRAAIGLVYYNDSNGWILTEN